MSEIEKLQTEIKILKEAVLFLMKETRNGFNRKTANNLMQRLEYGEFEETKDN